VNDEEKKKYQVKREIIKEWNEEVPNDENKQIILKKILFRI
jgi:hypothetical protein